MHKPTEPKAPKDLTSEELKSLKSAFEPHQVENWEKRAVARLC